MQIALGSTSAIKADAIRRAFPNCTVCALGIPSSVPEQPIGRNQTAMGARNRCVGAREGVTGGPVELAMGMCGLSWVEISFMDVFLFLLSCMLHWE
jgi:non-canonical (house-cleaning) NTP pyrophosphatase